MGAATNEETAPTEGGTPYRQTVPRGTPIGRYIILTPIGTGGVGAVYAAYDPQLDRKVAVKLMRPETSDRLEASESRGRMQREAQAMARLAHPNVVAVYDVGTTDDDVFVAMELIEGTTIKRWLAETPRSWREVRDMFVQAARGLAAAHAAGLVHRDFKPENVMVGADGRARVLDFGLARAAAFLDVEDETRSKRALADTALGSGSPLGASLTRTGTLLGTPAYMSPEQHLHQSTDERSDQFSFCIALYEALYGERPFPGETLAQLGMAVTQGKIGDPPKATKVPAWLRAHVVRGLSADPTLRFPSMDALIAAMLADPAVRRRRILIGAGVAVALVAAAGLGYRVSRHESTPPGASEVADKPQNLDFEAGTPGSPPTGWAAAGTDPKSFPVELIADGCVHGEHCARIRAEGPHPPSAFGTVLQGIDATQLRGKRVRFAVSVRPDGGALALPWLRVDRPKRQRGFFYNSSLLPAPAQAQWAEREIVGDVAADATDIYYGVMLLGSGAVTVDHAALDTVPATTPLTDDPREMAPRNLDFEAGELGAPAPGWLVQLQGDSHVVTTANAPHGGTRCLEIRGLGPIPATVQRIDATAWRGKHLHIAAAMRGPVTFQALQVGVSVPGAEEQWQPQRALAPGDDTQWRIADLDLEVAPNAETIDLAFFADEGATIWVDDITIAAR